MIILSTPEKYPKPCQMSNEERFKRMVNGLFRNAKQSSLDIWQGSENAWIQYVNASLIH